MQERLGSKLSIMTSKKEKKQTIQLVDDKSFEKRYDVGEMVMPSTHHDMEIKWGKRCSDNQAVVIKLRYKPNCFKSKEEEREWRRGTEFMLNLPQNIGVARIYEVLEDSRAFYIITEKAEGMDLFELLSTEKKFTVHAAREIMFELLQAIAHLHEHNGIHKDLKLENVVVDPKAAAAITSGEWSPKSVKLIDFDTVEEWTPRSPPAKDVMGTDQYISQEAYAGQYSPLSDIFSLGVIGYRLIAGRFPFKDEIFDDAPGENWVGSPKMNEIRGKLKNHKVNFNYHVFKECPEAAYLISSMLQYNEVDRPTAKQALESAFMQSRPAPENAEVPMEQAPSPRVRTSGIGLPRSFSGIRAN